MLLLIPLTQLFFGVEPDRSLKLPLLNRVAQSQVVVLSDEGEDDRGKIRLKRETRK